MLTKKGKLNCMIIGFIILTAIILIGSQAVQAQDWETWSPQNLAWLHWSPLISPMDCLQTPLVSSLNNDTLLPSEPALSWSPFIINLPYIPYNTTGTFNNNPLFFNAYNGINPWPPSYPIDPLKGLDTPVNLLIDSSSPSYSISYNMENGDSAGTAPSLPDYGILDVGPRIRELGPSDVTICMDGFEEMYANATASSANPPEFYGVGDIMLSLWLDDTAGGFFLALYEVRAIGEHIEVWVMTELDFPTTDDPRNPVYVSDEQIAYLIDQFDSNIWPKLTSFFGMPDPHDGSNAIPPFVGCYDPAGRVIAMISNIGDTHYYNPDYPIFIHGVYWGGFDYWLDRNVVSIDAYDWDNRLGSNDSSWRDPDPDKWKEYYYDMTLAHEFQHLLHADYDPDEEIFVNEGCSMFAPYLCGYGHPWGNLNEPHGIKAYPENSLVVWGDQGDLEIKADYGLVHLWTLNLYEHFGESFIQAMFHNPGNGITGINSTLASLGHEETFADIYHNFATSLVTDPGHKGGGAFAFKEIDFSVNADTPEAYNTLGAPPWGTDFIKIENPEEVVSISFNGDDFLSYDTPWTSIYIPLPPPLDGYLLYSGYGNLMDNWLIVPLDLTSVSSATLTLDHYYDIEDYWDFGFVQVSTDGGHTWTSLWDNEGLMTDQTDPDAHPKVKANVPGFTGWSGWFVTSTFDLSPYTGQNIYLAFRYITDWAILYDAWYIDEILVVGDGIPIFDHDGSSTDPFMDITQIFPMDSDFTVTVVGAKEKKGEYKFQVLPVNTDEDSEEGRRDNITRILSDSDYAVMLVTFDAPEGVTGYAGYTYDIVYNTTAKDSKPLRASSDKLTNLMN